MDPILMYALIGAGLGVAKNELSDKPQADIYNQLQAKKERYSPWTHQHAENLQQPNGFASALQGGVSGAMLGKELSAPKYNTYSTNAAAGINGANTASGLTNDNYGVGNANYAQSPDTFWGGRNPWGK